MDIPVEELRQKRDSLQERIDDLFDEEQSEVRGSPRASQVSGKRRGLSAFRNWLDQKIEEAEEE